MGPAYIYIDKDITKEDIHSLLKEASEKAVSNESFEMLVTLSLIEPEYRLSLNLKKLINIMAERAVSSEILQSGITQSEATMLVELDRKHLSEESRMTARCLLNVKERWLFRKHMVGTFNTARLSDAFITVDRRE